MSIRFTIAATVLSATLVVTAWTAAQDTKTKPGQGVQAAGADPAQKYLNDYDKNKDGSLTRDELPAGVRDEFADLDTNKDGKLSVEELRPHVARLLMVPVPVEITSVYLVESATHAPTLEELQAAYDLLRKADANHDGKITQEEAKAVRDHAIQDRVDSLFKRCDKNHDGKISKDECPDHMHGMFDRADKNKDGAVTKDELKACCIECADTAAGKTGSGGK